MAREKAFAFWPLGQVGAPAPRLSQVRPKAAGGARLADASQSPLDQAGTKIRPPLDPLTFPDTAHKRHRRRRRPSPGDNPVRPRTMVRRRPPELRSSCDNTHWEAGSFRGPASIEQRGW